MIEALLVTLIMIENKKQCVSPRVGVGRGYFNKGSWDISTIKEAGKLGRGQLAKARSWIENYTLTAPGALM